MRNDYTKLGPSTRNFLAGCAVGEVLSRGAIYRGCGAIKLRRLVDLGFVTSVTSTTYVRTDKLCPPRRQQNRKPRAYKGIFPWSRAAHWERMQRAAHRVRYHIARRLSGPRSQEDAFYDPVWLWSSANLKNARETLATAFGLSPSGRTTALWYCHTDEGLYYLLAEMQLKPTIEDGRVTGFAALSIAEADAILERRRADSLLERYTRAANTTTEQKNEKRLHETSASYPRLFGEPGGGRGV